MVYVPSATANRTPPQKDNRKTNYAILIGIIAVLLGYIIYDKTQDHKTETILVTTQETLASTQINYKNLDSAKNILQTEFDAVSHKVDTLTTANVKLEGALAARGNEIATMKSKISGILKKSNANETELKEAREMILQMNSKIDSYVAEIAKLKTENQQLTTEKNQLTADKESLTTEKNQLSTEKKNLENKVDVASTLTASHINITALKTSGKETETAKRADFFRLSFVVDENRVAASGNKSLYVVVTSPDGKTSVANGTFKTREGNEVQYTEKIDVNYEQGKVLPVSFDWKPGTQFVPGDYKVEIYNNGFKIGEAKKALKKGGLFS